MGVAAAHGDRLNQSKGFGDMRATYGADKGLMVTRFNEARSQKRLALAARKLFQIKMRRVRVTVFRASIFVGEVGAAISYLKVCWPRFSRC